MTLPSGRVGEDCLRVELKKRRREFRDLDSDGFAIAAIQRDTGVSGARGERRWNQKIDLCRRNEIDKRDRFLISKRTPVPSKVVGNVPL